MECEHKSWLRPVALIREPTGPRRTDGDNAGTARKYGIDALFAFGDEGSFITNIEGAVIAESSV